MSFEVLFELDAFQVVGLQPCSLAMLNFCGSIQLCGFLLQKTQKCWSFTDTCGYKTELHTGAHAGSQEFQLPVLLNGSILPFQDFYLGKTRFYTSFIILQYEGKVACVNLQD